MISNSLVNYQQQPTETQKTQKGLTQSLEYYPCFARQALSQNQGGKNSGGIVNLSINGKIVSVESSKEISSIIRQPLRSKFKGIIINKILGQIYMKNYNFCLHQSMKLLKDIKTKAKYQRKVSFQDLQRRTMIVLIQTTIYSIQKYILKVVRQAYNSLQEQNS